MPRDISFFCEVKGAGERRMAGEGRERQRLTERERDFKSPLCNWAGHQICPSRTLSCTDVRLCASLPSLARTHTCSHAPTYTQHTPAGRKNKHILADTAGPRNYTTHIQHIPQHAGQSISAKARLVIAFKNGGGRGILVREELKATWWLVTVIVVM